MITLGDHSYINGRDDRTNIHDGIVNIGKYTSVAVGVQFLAGAWSTHGSAGTAYVSNWPFTHIDKGPIIIGNDVWIGTSAIVLPGVTIGDGAQIGAGAVVTKDIPPYAVAVGVPAIVKKYRFSQEQIKRLLEIQWWNWPREQIDAALPLFEHIELFLERCEQVGSHHEMIVGRDSQAGSL